MEKKTAKSIPIHRFHNGDIKETLKE